MSLRKTLPALTGFSIVFLSMRLYRLEALPPFVDETIHFDLAQRALAGEWLAGLEIGKWLSIQTFAAFMAVCGDEWICTRLLVVLAGLFTALLLYSTGAALGSPRLGLASAPVYMALPLALFYDRLALSDPSQTVLMAIIVFLSVRVSQRGRLPDQIALGFALVLAPLFKSSGILYCALPALLVVVLSPAGAVRRGLSKVAVTYGLLLLALWPLYLVAPMEESRKLTAWESPSAAWELASHNLLEIHRVLWPMLTPSLVIVGVVGSVVLWARGDGVCRRRLLAWWSVVAVLIVPYLLFSNTWYPRYFLPVVIPVSLIAGEALAAVWLWCRRRFLGYLGVVIPLTVTLLVLLQPMLFCRRMLAGPTASDFPRRIANLYFYGDSSGYGVRETALFLRGASEAASQQPILVVRIPHWGQWYQGMLLHERELGDGVRWMHVTPWTADGTIEAFEKLLDEWREVYLLYDGSFDYPDDRPVVAALRRHFKPRDVWRHPKPNGEGGLGVLRFEKPAAPRAESAAPGSSEVLP